MAMLLQRNHSLTVVAVRMGESLGVPIVDLRLVVNTPECQRTMANLRVPLSRFGFAETWDSTEPDLQVPTDVCRWVVGSARSEISDQGVLWLHLVKPYDSLGAVPWERDLQEALGVPLLRLPDALPDPDQSDAFIDLALVLTAPISESRFGGARTATDVARAIAAAVGDRLRLHVFADQEVRAQLNQELARLRIGKFVVHSGHTPGSESPHPESEPQNGWLRWIRRETRGHTLDAVHFIVHGNSLGRDGAVLTSLAPDSTYRGFPVSVQSHELATFLTQTGALIAGFTRPTGNYSDYGLRRLVDDLGSERAGPVFMHDPSSDPSMTGLRKCYEFLTSPGPTVPPASHGLLLYAQPSHVARGSGGDAPMWAARPPFRTSNAVQVHFARGDTPQWIAAAERYLEQRESELLRFKQSSQSRQPTSTEQAYFSGMEAGIRKLRRIVDQHAERLL
jgi:hypothetical protein